MFLTFVILARVIANPVSNVFQKLLTRDGVDPLLVICATHGLMSLVAAPVFVFAVRGWGPDYWVNIALVAVLTVLGNVLLVVALKRSDLSVLGPINAYKSVVSLLPGMVLLGEYPTGAGLGGIALIVAGSYFVVDKDSARPRRNVFLRFFNDRGVQFRLAALVVSAVEAVFLKRALRVSSVEAVVTGWAVLGFGVSAVATTVLRRSSAKRAWSRFRASFPTFVWLAATTAVMQLCTVITFGRLPVGYALALFQTSTLLTVLLGWRVFGERNIAARLAGATVMAAGAALIVVSR